MLLCFSFTALFIKDPGPEQNLIEGASLKLQYDLRESRFKLNFFKDGMYLAEKVNVAENIFRKEKVTMDDQGDYFAKVNSIKSNITKVTVDGKIFYVSLFITLSEQPSIPYIPSIYILEATTML